MKAMVLAAGAGSRMGDITQTTPKPMLEVQGVPILGHILTNLARYGFTEVVINLFYHGEIIMAHCGDGSRYGVKLSYLQEDSLLGTAGSVKNAARLLSGGSPILVHYGDILSNQNLGAMTKAHLENRAEATLLVHQRSHSNSLVFLDNNQRVTQLLERPSEAERAAVGASSWVNSGIYLLDSDALEGIPSTVPCDFPRDVFPGLIQGGRVFGFPLTGYRCAIDSPERLELARREFISGKTPR